MKSMIIKANCSMGVLVGLYLLLSRMDGYVHPQMKLPIDLAIGYMLCQVVFIVVEVLITFRHARAKEECSKNPDLTLRQSSSTTVQPATVYSPMVKSVVLVLFGCLLFIVGCDNRTQEEKNYDEAVATYASALTDVESAEAGNTNLYQTAIEKLQHVRGLCWGDQGKKLEQDAENVIIKLFGDEKVRYSKGYLDYQSLDQYKQLAKQGDADAARICARFLWVQATAEPNPPFVQVGSFLANNKVGDVQLKEAYQILRNIPSEKFTDADSAFMDKLEAKFKEAIAWQNGQMHRIIAEGISLYPCFIKEARSFDRETLTTIQWKDQIAEWMKKWNWRKIAFRATVENVVKCNSVAELDSENWEREIRSNPTHEEHVVLRVRTTDNAFFRCHSTHISIYAPQLKVGQEICVLGRYDAPNSVMIGKKGGGSVLCDAVIIDEKLFADAANSLKENCSKED